MESVGKIMLIVYLVTVKTNYMKKLLMDLEYWCDMNLTIFLFNPNKVNRYNAFMTKKWGTRYTGK